MGSNSAKLALTISEDLQVDQRTLRITFSVQNLIQYQLSHATRQDITSLSHPINETKRINTQWNHSFLHHQGSCSNFAPLLWSPTTILAWVSKTWWD